MCAMFSYVWWIVKRNNCHFRLFGLKVTIWRIQFRNRNILAYSVLKDTFWPIQLFSYDFCPIIVNYNSCSNINFVLWFIIATIVLIWFFPMIVNCYYVTLSILLNMNFVLIWMWVLHYDKVVNCNIQCLTWITYI
jgi:hypothetical protein